MKRIVLAALAIVALVTTARAADQPLFSATRLSAGVTGNYCFYQQQGDQRLPDFHKSWEFGVVAAYNLVSQPEGRAPLLSATWSTNYDVDNKWIRHRVGLTLVLYKGGQ